MTTTAREQGKTASSSIEASAFEAARRAMFSAASRVLSYHAAALDAKVARFSVGQNPAPTYLQPQGAEITPRN